MIVPIQFAGLIVTSIMLILLFWKLIQKEQIETMLVQFVVMVANTLFTLLTMIGFFSGFCLCAPLLVFFYARSGSISRSEWLACVCVGGILIDIAVITIWTQKLIPMEPVLATLGVLSFCGLLGCVMTSEPGYWHE